jgi:hypothetical protein
MPGSDFPHPAWLFSSTTGGDPPALPVVPLCGDPVALLCRSPGSPALLPSGGGPMFMGSMLAPPSYRLPGSRIPHLCPRMRLQWPWYERGIALRSHTAFSVASRWEQRPDRPLSAPDCGDILHVAASDPGGRLVKAP